MIMRSRRMYLIAIEKYPTSHTYVIIFRSYKTYYEARKNSYPNSKIISYNRVNCPKIKEYITL